MQIAGNQHTYQDGMRCWPRDDMSVKSFRSAFIVLLKSPASQPNIVRLGYNHSQQTGLKWAPDGKASLACLFWALVVQLKLLHIVFDQHRNFCLNAIKIWSTMLCSSARRAVWAARLPSDELKPPCPRAPATQLWFIHFHREGTHTQNTQKLMERFAHYRLYIAYTCDCIDTNPTQEHKHTCCDYNNKPRQNQCPFVLQCSGWWC